MVQDATDAAELLAAPGPTGAAVDEDRERGAVARRLAGVVAVEDEDPSVPRGETEGDLSRDGRVVGDERADQAAPAPSGECDRLVEVPVGEDGRDRAEGLDVVRLGGATLGHEQDRSHERTLLGIGVDDLHGVRVAEDDPGRAAQCLDRLADLVALRQARQRTHPDALGGRVRQR